MSAHSSRRILISFCLTVAGLVAGALLVFNADAADYNALASGAPVNWTAITWGCTPNAGDVCGAYPGAVSSTNGNTVVIGGNAVVTVDTLLANPFSLNTQNGSGLNININPGGVMTLAGTSAVTGTTGISTVNINGGTLTNNGTLSVSSAGSAMALLFSGGTFNGSGTTTIGANGTLTFSGVQGPMTLNQAITNQNTTNFTATANPLTIGGVTFVNNAFFNVSGSGTINNGGGGQFNNASNFTLPNPGTFTANLPFNNTGTVAMTSSSGPTTLNLNGGGFQSGGTATWNVGTFSHILNFAGGILGHNFTGTQTFGGTSGQVNFTGGTNVIDTNMTIPFPVINSSDLRVGNTTTPALSISGNFTQTGAGSFTPRINGQIAGQYGKINISANAVLAGNLTPLFGYTPLNGHSFDVMTWLTHAGTMAYTPAIYPGGTVVAQYNPTFLRLIAAPTVDIGIAKGGPASVFHDTNASYTIKVDNFSAVTPATNVVITDTYPPGTATFVSATVPGGACTNVPGTITCTIPTIAPSTAVFISVTLFANNVGTITNTATLTSLNETDTNSANNSSSVTTTVNPASDLSIVKTASPDPVPAGGTLTYTLTVSNAGPDPSSSITVSDLLPASTTLVSATGTNWTCGGSAPVTCTSTTPVPVGGVAAPITIVVTAPTTAGPIVNQAQVGPTVGDPVPGNNSTSITTTVAPGVNADLSITKTGPVSVNAGQNLTFDVVITNNGPAPATGVVVSDPTPANTTFVSNTGACTTAYPCTIGTLSPGQTVAISSTYLVAATASASISNTASVSGSSTDPVAGNNSSTSSVPVVAASADVEIAKSGPTVLPPAGTVVFTNTVRNRGASVAVNVKVDDPTPTGLTFVSNSGNCTTPYPCLLGSMTSGQTRVITSTYSVNVGTTSVTNIATVSSTTPDPRSGNNVSAITLNASVCPSDAPIQIVPAVGATDAPADGSIFWTNVSRNYEVYFGRAGTGCNTLFATTSSSSVPYSGLVSGAEYESRIVATGDSCTAPLSSRCVKWRVGGGCGLEPPILIEPAAGATGRPSPVTFRWTRVNNAELYTLFVGVNGATPTEVGTTVDTSFSTHVATGPVVWYVVASSRTCASARSANGQFDSCSSPATPIAGVEGAPISGTLYSVVWDAVPGATRYEVDEAQNETFTGLTTISTTDTRMPFSHRTVVSPAVYFYRVRAFGGCTNLASANSRTVRVVILPPVPTSSLNVPVGSRTKIKHLVFIPGEADQAYNFIATSDKPWFTVNPVAGVLPQSLNGVTFEVEVDPTDLPNGTITGTIVLNLLPVSAGSRNVITHAVTAKSQPVSVNLVTPVKPGDVASPTADTLIIPSVGHLAGINSLWRSDIRILNTAGAKAKYQLDFITSGAEDVKQTIIEVDANGTTALDDIVHNWYGFGEVGDSANGILQIRPLSSGITPSAISSSLTTAASSRTYSTSGTGTLGQFIPAVQFGNFIGKTGVLSLQQIAQSANYRTNVGVVEAAGKPVSVLLSIFNSAGSNLMDVPLDLKAGEQKQLNGFLATNGITLDDGRIEVRVTDGDGKVTAYASVVDNKSIDPLLVAAVPLAGPTSQRYVLPGVADLNTGSASWRTDMRIFNSSSTPQSATITFHPLNNASAPQSTNITVQPDEVRVLNSVLESLFAARDIGGAIHVLTSNASQLTVTGRTYNQTSNGTFGQFTPAVMSTEGADRASRALNILQVEDSVRYRTNIGIAEITGNPATVEVTVNLPDSKITPKVEIPLAANEFRQFAIIRELGLQNIYNARVTVKVISGTGSVTAYGSVIDMITSDPTYVPAQ